MRLREHEGIIPGRAEINNCRPSAITVEDGYNVRDLTTPDARAELDELKAQVREHGILTPLKIRFDGETIVLVEGHRRLTVVKELIAEHEASGGKEGRSIVSVPIFPETAGTTVEDRDAGLVVSNSGTRLKPLELANLIFRMNTVRGMPHELVAQRLSISMAVLRNHLAMRAMPEPVKEQVRAGDISATEAAKLVKNLPKGTDPIFAAEQIKRNKEENKRLGVGAKNGHKVTPKTLKRDRPKPAAKAEPVTPAIEPEAYEAKLHGPTIVTGFTSPPADDPPPAPSMAALQEQIERITTAPAVAPPPRSYDINQKFFAIVCRLATIAEGYDLNALADDHMVEIPAEVLKAADRDYRAHVGDV